MYSDKQDPQPKRALALLTAITSGEAVVEDIAKELRNEGIQSLEELIVILRENIKEAKEDEINAMKPINFQNWRRKTSQESISNIVQKVPKVPFILNGTMYDPEDITRFNGQELHFILAPEADHMLVVDDRDLIADWWSLAYFERFKNSSMQHETEMQTRMRLIIPHTGFFEDVNFSGYALGLLPNRGYNRLSSVVRGFFGDWNDEISSVSMIGTNITVLYEHKNWAGATLTLTGSESDLHRLGWGDRASSIATW
ncbi:hypothetical protein ACVAMH_31185 [Bacillus zanthoxyli]